MTDQLKSITAADLPIDQEGRIYHLQARPDQVAENILIVGDPGRAKMIGRSFFKDIEVDHEHRGLVTITGQTDFSKIISEDLSPIRTTVTTSGMGTPSLEIILQEIVALNEINLEKRTEKKDFPIPHIIRVGTSGGLQSETKLGTPVITSYSIGLDNTGLFYEAPYADTHCQRLEKEIHEMLKNKMDPNSRFYGKIYPYVSRADSRMITALKKAADMIDVSIKVGLTVSCGGFFAPQGRHVTRIPPSILNIDQILTDYDPNLDGQKIENMEMESSFLNHLFGGLGYPSGAICIAIANRKNNTFDDQYQTSIANAIKIALLALAITRQ
jgi:uridine phosphorylase